MKREVFKVRESLKKFFDDDKVLSSDAVASMVVGLVVGAYKALKEGKEEAAVTKELFEKLSDVLGTYEAGERKVYWQEFKRLYDAGVIKQAAFIDYLMKEHGRTQEDAVKYIATIFGMKGSTQAVYLSEEFKLRQKEKERRGARPNDT